MTTTTAVGSTAGAGLGCFPTPIHELPRLWAAVGSKHRLLVKRDDLCGIGAGGSKVRKLRCLLDARKADVVLTTGGLQSNSCALTALYATALGLPCEQLLVGARPAVLTGNLRISEEAGATMRFLGDVTLEEAAHAVDRRAAGLERRGQRPIVVPLGGSTAAGARGMVDVVGEIAASPYADQVTDLVTATGSVGTLAGLVVGTWVHDVPWTVHGYCVLWPATRTRLRLEELLHELSTTYFSGIPRRANYRVCDGQLGEGYGVPHDAGRAATRLLATLEGILLDPTYTAKGMAGMLSGLSGGAIGGRGSTVFYHSGGLAGYLA